MFARSFASPGGLNTEQRVLEHVKGALRVMVEWEAPAVSLDRKRSSVRHALRSFCRHLERLMDYEEQGGYLAQVMEELPNWTDRVQELKGEHEGIRGRIKQLTSQLNDSGAWEAGGLDCACLAIRDLLDEVDHHDRQEIALLQETLLNEEGGEG